MRTNCLDLHNNLSSVFILQKNKPLTELSGDSTERRQREGEPWLPADARDMFFNNKARKP